MTGRIQHSCGAYVVGLIVAATGWCIAPAAAEGYVATPGPVRASVSLTVTYTGSGSTTTNYRSQPPNPGGHSDSNHVEDSTAERWSLRFSHQLVIPTCDPAGVDPCAKIGGLLGAAGPTQIVGHIHHVHKDGLFRADDRAERCTVMSHTHRGRQRTQLQIAYDGAAGVVRFTAVQPMPSTLILLPGGCPGRGDSFDLLLDNYFSPGFSFDQDYTPDRWFTSRTVAVPLSVLHASTRIAIPVGLIPANTPPLHCAVAHPKYEQCTTTGSWTGKLVLTATA